MRLRLRGEANEARADAIARTFGINRIAALLLTQRGVCSDEDVRAFLSPSLAALHDPFLFANMRAVCERVQRAVRSGERIAVYSDYDADGVCGAAVLTLLLRELGVEPLVYIPSRFGEGYGMNVPAVKELLAKGVSLIITVDCGITNVAETLAARRGGADVIILDHHEAGELPDTPYIIDAKAPDEPYPFAYLCGAGVAFKLACALTGRNDAFLEIAAVATIGDIVSLTGENRAIAAVGLKRLREGAHAGVWALAEKSLLKPAELTATDVAFSIVPRLNAAGRLLSANPAYRLMLATDPIDADTIATELAELNFKRKYMQQRIVESAVAQAEKLCLSEQSILTLSGADYEEGVIGIAASMVCERFCRPAVIIKEDERLCVGSARSLPGINVYEALRSCRELMTKFGGHAMAAGFSLPLENVPELKRRLAAYPVPAEPLLRTSEYDAVVTPEDITYPLLEELSRLAPFGEGNPQPVFLIDDVTAKDERRIGKTGDHLRFCVCGSGGAVVNAVKFNTRESVAGFSGAILGETLINSFDDRPQIIARTLIPRDPAAKAEAANEKEYMRVFPAEVKALLRFMDSPAAALAPERAAFAELIAAAVAEGPMGTALAVNSRAGLAAVRAYGFAEGLEVYSEFPKDSAENCFCTTARAAKYAHNYKRVFACGAFCLSGATMFLSDAMIKAYRQEAKRFVCTEERLSHILAALTRVSRNTAGFETMSQIISAIEREARDCSSKQIWLALNIFSDLKLIEFGKSDRIHIKFGERRVLFAESPTYRAFDRIMGFEL